MAYGKQAARYREMEVLSATPGQLVVILYDHLLLTLRRTHVAMEAKAHEERMLQLDKARAALTELLVTLDLERGGEIARNLSALYSFLLGELIQVGVSGSMERLDRIIGIVSELRDAFAHIATLPESRVPVAQAV
jgi:flagellar protein FliS